MLKGTPFSLIKVNVAIKSKIFPKPGTIKYIPSKDRPTTKYKVSNFFNHSILCPVINCNTRLTLKYT